MCFILPIKKKCLASHARLKGKLQFKLQGSVWWFANFLLISHSLDCKCLWRHYLKAADLTRGVPNIWVFLEWTFFWTFCVRHASLTTGQNSELPAVVLTTWSKSSTDVASIFFARGFGSWFRGVVPQPWGCAWGMPSHEEWYTGGRCRGTKMDFLQYAKF